MASVDFVGITFEEYLQCNQISFEWACSYDTKDWARLERIILPKVNIDYTAVMGPGRAWPNMPAADYLTMMSRADQLGNPLVCTQHLLAGSSWKRTSETEITGTHQIRAAHIRYAADESGNRSENIVGIAHSHGVVEHFYRRDENGRWKFAGLRPAVIFNQGDLPSLFDFEAVP